MKDQPVSNQATPSDFVLVPRIITDQWMAEYVDVEIMVNGELRAWPEGAFKHASNEEIEANKRMEG